MFKSYLRLQITLAVILLAMLAAFNIQADPYARFGRDAGDANGLLIRFPTVRSWANTTIHRVAHHDYDAIFIGNSRTWRGLDPDHMKGVFKAYNASFSSLNFEDIYTVLLPILAKKKISTLVIGLDFGMERKIRAKRLVSDLSAKGFSPAGFFSSILGFYTTKDSLILLRTKRSGLVVPEIRPDGFIITDSERRSLREQREILNEMIGGIVSLGRSPMSRSDGWRYFKDIVEECRERNINLIMFLSPIHVKLMEGIHESGLYGEFEDWIRMIVDIAYKSENRLEDYQNVSVWSFCGYNSITTDPFPESPLDKEMQWYFEASHYRPEVGDMVLYRMLGSAGGGVPEDFGALLTPKNINVSLERMRLEREAYLDGKLK